MTKGFKAISAAALLGFALPAAAAVSISENFTGPTVSPDLSVQTGWAFGGTAVKSGGGRNYISTQAADYNTIDFIMTIDYTLNNGGGPGIAIFGFGSAAANGGWFGTPGASFWSESRPSDFDAGDVQWSTRSDFGGGAPPEVTFGNAGNGSHRFKIEKVGDNVTMSVDVGANGSYDGSVTKSLSTDLPFLNNTNSRLFFGSESSNATFDNLSITVVPEPGASVLAGLAALGLLRRRRK